MSRLVHLLAAVLLAGCPAAQPAEEQRPDPSLRALDRLVESGETDESQAALRDCLAQAERATTCPPLAGSRRSVPLRLALDPRYIEHWPDWKQRLITTLGCVNRLYAGTGVTWTLESAEPWDPGADRHDLRTLLRRLQQDYQPDLRSVLVGITVWDERRIYARAGGEIGLSQRAACVVPSWPRIENDCLTLAHELGHILGARHVPVKQSIMAWAGHMFHLPATDAVKRVVATHRFDPRNLEAIRLYHRARFTKDGLALPVSCVERLEAMDRCWKL